MPDYTPTAVYSTRCNHTVLATIYHYFRERGVEVTSISSLIRTALEDYANLLIDNKVAPEYGLSAAMTSLEALGSQPSQAHKLRRTLALAVTREVDVTADQIAGALSKDEIDKIMQAMENGGEIDD